MPLALQNRENKGCPHGGTLYACSVPQFRGCCLVDACHHSGCPPDQIPTPRTSVSITNGWPTSTVNAADSTPTSSSSIDTIESVSLGQTVTLTVTYNATQSSQPTTDASLTTGRSGGSSKPVGAIAGGTVGGVVLLASAIFLLFFLRRRKRTKEQEQRRATLPSPYLGRDMSEQLIGTTTTYHSETKIITTGNHDTSPDPVPQLDSIAVVPTSEANVDALGNIPELPATEKNSSPSASPHSSSKDHPSISKGEQRRHDSDNHVMSWAQFNSMGTRNSTSRLSQPHLAPDATSSVWGNMNSKKV